MEPDLLFVYGTLLQKIENSTSHFLKKNGRLLGTGYMSGALYDVGSYPGAVYHPDSKETVTGEIVKLRRVAAVLQVLDEYEGFDPLWPQGGEYIRSLVPVHINLRTVNAWVYLYNFSIEKLVRIPNGDYLTYWNNL